MSMYEEIFHRQELYDSFAKGEVKPLEDLYGIEDVALSVKEIEEKIDFYKGLKKKKMKDINDAIKVLENKLDFFKDIVRVTLEDNGEKSVDFPGSCKASLRNLPKNWTITDEEEFIKIMEQAEDQGEDVAGVVEEVVEYVVRKKMANKLLDTWEKNGKIDQYINKENVTPCVLRDEPKKSVSFTYPKNIEEDNEVIDETVPMKDDAQDQPVEEFDSLTI